MEQLLGELLARVRRVLTAVDPHGAALEADELVAYVLDVERARLLAMRSDSVTPKIVSRVDALLARRTAGEPMAYIVGHTGFYGREFLVEPGVLIPRVDTEVLVAAALWALKDAGRGGAGATGQGHKVAAPRLLELGIGAGGVICTLLCEVAGATATGTDLTATPLKVTAANADKLGVGERLALLQGSWFEALRPEMRGTFDLIAANPPYVPVDDRDVLQDEVLKHEPDEAIFAPDQGTEHHRHILERARSWLAPGGRVALEMGYGQAIEVREIAAATGWKLKRVFMDTLDIERVLVLA